jgi:DNA-directed RNA polymerase beta' subunit
LENGKPKYVRIGDWIDGHLDDNKGNIQHFPEDRNMEFLPLNTKVYIPTADQHGNTSWGELTAVTRHDPGERLYEVTTQSGRKVTVAESKSLLIWDEKTKTFEGKYSPDVKVGDFVPVTASLPDPPVITKYVEMTDYFPKNERCLLSERFELDKEFGIFIGLYLAVGSTDSSSGIVSITNLDDGVRSFVKSWFDKYSVQSTDTSRINKIGGTSTSIIGYSSLLVRFLDKFVGHGVANKHIPDVALTGPRDFVVGILNGYFSGNGTIGLTNIDASSASERLIEGVSFMCSRLGVFGKTFKTQLESNNDGTKNILPSHCISICGQWASAFVKTVDLIIDSKQRQLHTMKPSCTHGNFTEVNDVVMDAIKEINVVDTSKNPKLYDVTVPSTLNFTTGNMLTLLDTSEIGYLQRKLVKAMEDCKVAHDCTVRNASGSIVQFLYGEDGMDPTKIESQTIYYIEMDYDALVKNYLITSEDALKHIVDDSVIDALKATSKWTDAMRAHFNQILEDREFMIDKIFQNKKDSTLLYPVSFSRIINTCKALFGKPGVMLDLNPMYVLQTVDKMCAEMKVGGKYNAGNKFIQILLRCFLSPKQMICVHRFDKMVFDHIVKEVKTKFYEAINNPSEMVGVIAAQSIGEPTTQLTLNSVHWSTPILFEIDGKLVKEPIGAFVDHHIHECADHNIERHPNDTLLAWVRNHEVKVLACDKQGRVGWQRVEAVTRHPVINKDGTNTLLKIKTFSGRQVVCTKAKSLLAKVNNEIIPVNGEDLKIGDLVPVSRILPVATNTALTYDDGAYAARMGAPATKLLEANEAFLHGYLDSKSMWSVTSRDDAENVQQLLVKFGGHSRIVSCEGMYYVVFDKFPQAIPVTLSGKDKVIERQTIDYMVNETHVETDILTLLRAQEEDVFYDYIVCIEEIANDRPWVYDLTVENTRTFNAFNGLCCDDTFHSSGVSSASKAVRGVPRIKELLSVSKNQKAPSMIIGLKPEISHNKNKSKDVMNTIQTIFFSDLVKSSKMYYDVSDFKTTIEDDAKFIESYKDFVDANMLLQNTSSPWLLRFELDKDKMKEYDVTMNDVNAVLQEHYDESVTAMFSDDNFHQLIFRIRVMSSSDSKKAVAAAAAAAAENEDGSVQQKDYITELKALEKSMLENLIIKGVKKINKAAMNKQEYFKYNKDTMQFEKTHEWVIETAGTNMIEIIGHPDIDPYHTISNDVTEIYELFGIEAARQALYNELNSVIKDGDLYINYRHLALLVDTMTNRGYLMSIDRHGINRVDIGPLAKCSFEEVTDMLTKAGVFADIDRITGISANVMLGQIPKCGTGDTQILLDEERLMQLSKETVVPEKEEEEEDPVDIEQYCSFDNLTFDFSMPEIDKSIKRVAMPQIKLT